MGALAESLILIKETVDILNLGKNSRNCGRENMGELSQMFVGTQCPDMLHKPE